MRLIVAVTAGLLVASGFLAAAFVVKDLSTQGAENEFATPLPEPGEMAIYSIVQVDGDGDETALGELQAVWVGKTTVRDGQGDVRPVESLHLNWSVENTTLWEEFHVEPEARAPLAWTHLLASDSRLSTRIGVGMGDSHVGIVGQGLIGNVQDVREVQELRFEQGPIPCGFLHDHQGQMSPSDGLWSYGCQELDGAARLDLVGTSRVPGHDLPAYVFRSADGRSVWLWTQNPFPLQLDVPLDASILRLRQVSYLEAETETPTTIDWMEGTPPDIEAGPRHPWGPDETGVDHPYPNSAAFQGALNDPNFPDLRDFMNTHPGAYVSAAFYHETDHGEVKDHEWTWEVSDGRETLVVTLFQHHAFAVQGVDSGGLLGTPEAWVTEYGVGRPENTTAPLPEAAPELLPKVSNVMDQWRWYAPPELAGQTAQSWGFRIACRDEACQETEAWVAAGVSRSEASATSPVVTPLYATAYSDNEWTGTEHLLGASLDQGRLFVYDGSRSQTLGTLPAFEPSREGASPLPVDSTGTPPLPIVLAAVGSSVLVAVLAVAAKTAWAPLFSRVRLHDALKSPPRAALYQAIQANPGVHFADLTRDPALPGKGSAEYHLKRLTELDLVRRVETGGYVCFFPSSGLGHFGQRAAGAMKSPTAKNMMGAIAVSPGITASRLADQLGVQPSTVLHHLRRLMEADLVERTRAGRAYQLRLTSDGKRLLGSSGA